MDESVGLLFCFFFFLDDFVGAEDGFSPVAEVKKAAGGGTEFSEEGGAELTGFVVVLGLVLVAFLANLSSACFRFHASAFAAFFADTARFLASSAEFEVEVCPAAFAARSASNFSFFFNFFAAFLANFSASERGFFTAFA